MPGTNLILEERIRYWLHRIEQGKPVTMSVCVRRQDGTVYPLGVESYARLAAARLVGAEEAPMYIIEEKDATPDRLESLRKALEQLQAEGN